MEITRLDTYDYIILPGVIRIGLTATNDPDLVDIMSEIERSGGHIYVDGHRYLYLDKYQIVDQGADSYIELDVVEMH